MRNENILTRVIILDGILVDIRVTVIVNISCGSRIGRVELIDEEPECRYRSVKQQGAHRHDINYKNKEQLR